MSLKNRVQLIGNVGSDPEIRKLDSGVTVASFSFATSETFTNKSGEKVTDTQWHRIVAYNKIAEIIEKYVIKGSQLTLSGKIKYGKYENKDGVTVYTTDIICEEILLGKKPEEQSDNDIEDSNPF